MMTTKFIEKPNEKQGQRRKKKVPAIPARYSTPQQAI